MTLVGGTPGSRRIEKKRDTYFLGIYRGKRLHAIKIGLATRGRVHTRIANLQTGSVDRLNLLAVAEGSLERKFHRKFAGYRIGKSEFFKPAPELLKLIDDLVKIRSLVEKIEASNGGRASFADRNL